MTSPALAVDGTSVLESYDKKKFSWFHVKVILISGMGFFTDAYDLFSISLLVSHIDSPAH